jgi:uncharacterized protein (DUF342 family)
MISFFLPDWVNGFNFLLTLFAFLVAIAVAAILIYARRGTDISTLQTDRATAAEALLKIRENELASLKLKHEDTEEELESVTAEFRAVTGIKIHELLEFWAEKDSIEARIRNTERENRILTKQINGD